MLDLELPEGVDGGLRFADLDVSGPRKDGRATKLAGGRRKQGAAVDGTVSPDAPLTDRDVDAAIADFDTWAGKQAADLVGLLGAAAGSER